MTSGQQTEEVPVNDIAAQEDAADEGFEDQDNVRFHVFTHHIDEIGQMQSQEHVLFLPMEAAKLVATFFYSAHPALSVNVDDALHLVDPKELEDDPITPKTEEGEI